LLILDLEHVSRLARDAGGRGARVDFGSPLMASVALWGELPVGWAGRLAAGLAARGFDTRSAAAQLSREHGWLAAFEVHSAMAGLADGELDVLGMCKHGEPEQSELVVSHFSLERDHDAALELRVVAPDRIGFLAALLGKLAFFSLFPESMRITTAGDQAHDVLRLRALGGGVPGPAIERALRLELTRAPTVPPPQRRSAPPERG
jgi:hypothetical protein